nr:SMI1/KNR4 family protein [uncultured Blautia sp.]
MGIIELIKEKTDLITYSPVTLECINEAEKNLQVTFSKEYVEYVATFGVAIFEGHELTGICDGKRLDVVHNTVEQRRLNPFVPSNWYVIECLDIDGVVIWQDEAGKVYQTLPSGNMVLIGESIVEYLES